MQHEINPIASKNIERTEWIRLIEKKLDTLHISTTLLLPLLKDDSKELKRLMELADETGATLTKIEADTENVGIDTADRLNLLSIAKQLRETMEIIIKKEVD